VAVGKPPAGAEVEDLGNVALLPGLVNAHTHLEFGDLSAPLGEPGMAFVDWIRRLVDRFRQVPRCSDGAIGRGLCECVRCGTTTLGEIAQPGWPVKAFQHAALDAIVFLELIAPTPERVAGLLESAPQHVQSGERSTQWRPGLSPHAPYSVLTELLAAAVSISAARCVPVAFHLAESLEELELMRSGSGALRDYLEELGTCDRELFAPGRRPLDYLRTLASAHRALVIHGNYLDDEEIAFLAGRADRMSVVYCPRTHYYFRHESYPLRKMLSAGVQVALGTDSRASAPDLSVLAEMRHVARYFPSIGRDTILRLGTLDGAAALGRAGEVGSLEPGKLADLAAVALPDRDADDAHELLFDSAGPVTATWHRGKLAAAAPDEINNNRSAIAGPE